MSESKRPSPGAVAAAEEMFREYGDAGLGRWRLAPAAALIDRLAVAPAVEAMKDGVADALRDLEAEKARADRLAEENWSEEETARVREASVSRQEEIRHGGA